jgi:hypothetical protein
VRLGAEAALHLLHHGVRGREPLLHLLDSRGRLPLPLVLRFLPPTSPARQRHHRHPHRRGSRGANHHSRPHDRVFPPRCSTTLGGDQCASGVARAARRPRGEGRKVVAGEIWLSFSSYDSFPSQLLEKANFNSKLGEKNLSQTARGGQKDKCPQGTLDWKRGQWRKSGRAKKI